jgi:predicted GNAT family acetyltransferase
MIATDRQIRVTKFYDDYDVWTYRQIVQFLKLATHWSDKRTVKQIVNAIANSTATYIAYSGTEIVGFGRVVSDRVHIATLTDICVHPNFYGMAIGTRIVEALCQEVPDCEMVLATTSKASDFYLKLGFTEHEYRTLVLRR